MSGTVFKVVIATLLIVSIFSYGVTAEPNNTSVECSTSTDNSHWTVTGTASPPWNAIFFEHDIPVVSVNGRTEAVRPHYNIRMSPERDVVVTVNFQLYDNYSFPFKVNNRFAERSQTKEIAHVEGFDRDDKDRFVWDRRMMNPNIKYVIEGDGLEKIGDGLYLRGIAIPRRSIFADSDFNSLRVLDPRYSIDGSGYITVGGSVYLGEHSTYDVSGDQSGESFVLIVPEALDQGKSHYQDDLDRLAKTSEHLHVGERHSKIEMLLVPRRTLRSEGDDPLGTAYGTMMNVGRWSNRASFVVANGSSEGRHTFIHEYIHTRTEYVTEGENMTWFTEGLTEYYEHLFAYRSGKITHSEFYRDISTVNSNARNAVLADAESWRGSNVPYTKGALVMAALDHEIRQRTDGERSLQHVIWRMNADVNPIFSKRGFEHTRKFETWYKDGNQWMSYQRFEEILRYVTGHSFDDWLNQYAKSDDIPDLPEEERIYQRPTYQDEDGDGIIDSIEQSIGTSPTEADTDGDGIPDEEEVFQCLTDPKEQDTDGDGIPDRSELLNKTSPIKTDTDRDQFSDREEIENGTDPIDDNSYPESDRIHETTTNGFTALSFAFAFMTSLTYILIQSRHDT